MDDVHSSLPDPTPLNQAEPMTQDNFDPIHQPPFQHEDNSDHVNWYPGHMLKAKKELQKRLKEVDVVLEVRDARIPEASVNPDFEAILRQKRRVVVFNKTDLADPALVEGWRQHFHQQHFHHLFIDLKAGRNLGKILPLARKLMKDRWERYKVKGIRPPELKMAVVGVPNVGKSSLINRLVRKKAVKTGPIPGVTMAQQWTRIGQDVELLDTPGILWPRLDDQVDAYKLACCGSIKDSIVGEWKLAQFLMEFFLIHYAGRLAESFAVQEADLTEEAIHSPHKLQSLAQTMLHRIAIKRGCLKQHQEVDELRVAKLVLKQLREGNMGQVSFEKPPIHT